MPRLLGVDIPNDKRNYIALQYLYGVGEAKAQEICFTTGIDPLAKARSLTDDELSRIANLLDKEHVVEGAPRRGGKHVGCM